jgi:hypothetical protein
MSFDEIAGKVIVEMLVAIGVSLGTPQLGQSFAVSHMSRMVIKHPGLILPHSLFWERL